MRIFCAAAMIALLAGPAYAQSVPRYGDLGKAKTPQEIESDRAAEKAYKASLGNIPDKASVDPWGNARSVDAPKTVTKTVTKVTPKAAAKRTKTGNAAN